MKTILLLLTAIMVTAAARADEQVISTFSWKELADAATSRRARSPATTRSKSRITAQAR